MAAAPNSPRWVSWGPGDARSGLRVLKARVYAEPAPSGSSARVLWSLDHVCRAIPAAAEGRVTKWLQRAGAPSSRSKFCLLRGLCEFDWLPSLLSKDGRDAAKRDRSLRAGNDARCGTKYMLALLLMWSHTLRKGGQEAAKCILEDILRKVEGCLPGREFPVAAWDPGPRGAGRDTSSPEPGGCDAQPLAAQSVGVPLSADSRADAAHLASLMLAQEEKIRNCQSSSAWLRRVLACVSEKIEACVIAGSIATTRYDAIPKDFADPRGKSGKRRRVDADVMAQAEGDIVEGASRSLRDASRQTKRFSVRTAGRRADTNLLGCKAATRACFAGENRVSIAFDGTDLGCEGTLSTCIYSTRKRKASWLIPKAGRFFNRRWGGIRGAEPPTDGAFSPPSVSHQPVIIQASIGHRSAISQSSVCHQRGASSSSGSHQETEGPVPRTEGGAFLCRWEGLRGARPPTDNTLSQSSASHHPGVNQTSVVHQSAISWPSAGRGALRPNGVPEA